MAAKKKKKQSVPEAEASGQEMPRIVFPASMTGTKPKATPTASTLRKTKVAEADARKRKQSTDEAPPTKK